MNFKINKNKLGNRLASIRKAYNLTQKEIAEIIGGISQHAISKWELGKRQPQQMHIKKYSEIFDVDLNWILYGDFEMWVENVLAEEHFIMSTDFLEYLKENNLYEVYDKKKILSAYIPEQSYIDREFTIVYNSIYDDEKLTSTDLVVYQVLCFFANNNNSSECFPSHQEIANKARISRYIVINSIKKLVERGHIIKYPRYTYDGTQISNKYYIVSRKMEDIIE